MKIGHMVGNYWLTGVLYDRLGVRLVCYMLDHAFAGLAYWFCVGCVYGWLAGWLIGWLIGWLVSWMVK